VPPWPETFATTAGDRDALLRIASLYNFSPRALYELADRHGSAACCLEAICDGDAGSKADRERLRSMDTEAIARTVASCGARLVTPNDGEYPASLEDLVDPPALVFVRGRSLANLYPRVAVVGSRRCTRTGAELSRRIGAGLARAGVTVVSGGAIGIDGQSHKGALQEDGPTLAVLGCGIDVVYPPSHRGLLREIEAAGALVSEYPPGVRAEAFRFPARNRIISALAEGVVVVEGAAGSGSLITIRHALDLGREVFAVPGSVTHPLSEVPLALIRDGARLIRGADDLLLDLGRLDPQAGMVKTPELSDRERAVLDSLAVHTLPERIAEELGWDVGETLGALVGLELRGLVRSVGGRFELRLAPSA
jgi:DNA processing protein